MEATVISEIPLQSKTALQLKSFDPASAAFVLNPGNDLARTQNAFEKEVFAFLFFFVFFFDVSMSMYI